MINYTRGQLLLALSSIVPISRKIVCGFVEVEGDGNFPAVAGFMPATAGGLLAVLVELLQPPASATPWWDSKRVIECFLIGVESWSRHISTYRDGRRKSSASELGMDDEPVKRPWWAPWRSRSKGVAAEGNFLQTCAKHRP